MQVLKDWADFHWEIRNFFREQNFLEVITPIVVSCPGTEPAIEPFQTSLKQGSKITPLFLRTSPELKIKRLLSKEIPKIFEIATVFRNEENTPLHSPEFQMLEWYRAGEPLEQLETDVEQLIAALLRKFHRAEQLPVFSRQTVRDFISEALGVVIEADWGLEEYKQAVMDVRELDGDRDSVGPGFGGAGNGGRSAVSVRLDGDRAAGGDLASSGELTSANLSGGAEWTVDDLFFQLMHAAEKTMKPDRLYILNDYPPFQAAYARIGMNGWAARFEVYWKGMEIANAFWEVTDPEVQRQRFQDDIAKKVAQGKTAVPVDEEFLRYLDAGKFPESSGIALGVERLFMAIFDYKNINELDPFMAK